MKTPYVQKAQLLFNVLNQIRQFSDHNHSSLSIKLFSYHSQSAFLCTFYELPLAKANGFEGQS